MSDPRFCIIPARALEFASLKGGDLRVLCYFGKHADKNGWWRLSQVKMAESLDCARSTIQASIKRLVEAELVEKHEVETASGRDSAHFYRVVFDHGSPEIGVPKEVLETRAKAQKEGADIPAGVPDKPAGGADPGPAGGADPGPAPSITEHSNDPLSRDASASHSAAPAKPPVGDEREIDRKKREVAFKRFAPTWPTWLDSSETKAREAWFELTDADCEQAEARAEEYVAKTKAAGRAYICALQTYLRERRWEKLGEVVTKTDIPKRVHLPVYSKDWMAQRIWLLKTFKPANEPMRSAIRDERGLMMMSRSRCDLLSRYPYVAMLDEGEGFRLVEDPQHDTSGFVKVKFGSQEFEAWQAWHDANGWPRLPEPGHTGDFYFWMQSEQPPSERQS